MTDFELQSILEGFKSKIQALIAEKEKLDRHRAEVERQIAGLQQSVTGLQAYANAAADNGSPWRALFSEIFTLLGEAAKSWSLTEMCRQILKSTPKALSASEIKDEMERRGFSFAGYQSNPTSSISTTLKRLVDANEAVEKLSLPGNVKVYQWLHKSPPSPNSLAARLYSASTEILPPPDFAKNASLASKAAQTILDARKRKK